MSRKQHKKKAPQGFQIEEEFAPIAKNTKNKKSDVQLLPPKANYTQILIKDVLKYIFEFVDQKTLVRITMVCKEWRESAQNLYKYQLLPNCEGLPKNKAIADYIISNFFHKTKFEQRQVVPETNNLDCHHKSITGVVFDGKTILSSSQDRSLKVWNGSGCKTTYIDFPSKQGSLGVATRHSTRRPRVWGANHFPAILQLQRGKLLLACNSNEDFQLQLYDWNSKKMLFDVHGSVLGKMSSDGTKLVVCDSTSTTVQANPECFQILNTADGEVMDSFHHVPGNAQRLTAVDMLDTIVGFGNVRGEVCLVSGILTGHKTVSQLQPCHNSRVTHLSFVGSSLISAGKDAMIFVYDVVKEACLDGIVASKVQTNGVSCLYAEDWRMVVGHCEDHAIRIYDRRMGCKRTAILTEHTEPVKCLDVDGIRMITGSADTTVKLWDWRRPSGVVHTFGFPNNEGPGYVQQMYATNGKHRVLLKYVNDVEEEEAS